jgi:hypothetical protein
MAYTVDLILVLKSLFDFTLRPSLVGTPTWEVLQNAFEAYERSDSRRHIHDSVSPNFQRSERILDQGSISKKIAELVGKY